MEIEKQILNQATPVSVDRAEVHAWLEREKARTNRNSTLTFTGVALLLACALGLVYQLLESQSNAAKQLVGTLPSSHTLMLEEITDELFGEEPAKYWTNQISLIGTQDSLASY